MYTEDNRNQRWGESVDIVAERIVVVYFFYSDELSTFFYHNYCPTQAIARKNIADF